MEVGQVIPSSFLNSGGWKRSLGQLQHCSCQQWLLLPTIWCETAKQNRTIVNGGSFKNSWDGDTSEFQVFPFINGFWRVLDFGFRPYAKAIEPTQTLSVEYTSYVLDSPKSSKYEMPIAQWTLPKQRRKSMHFVLRPTCCSFWSNHILRVHFSSTLFLFTLETDPYLVDGHKKDVHCAAQQLRRRRRQFWLPPILVGVEPDYDEQGKNGIESLIQAMKLVMKRIE